MKLRTIIKHKNRKYYDKIYKMRVYYAEIQEFIDAGERIRVLCKDTGTDLTADTMRRMLVSKEDCEDVNLMHEILATYGTFSNYIQKEGR